MNNKCCLGIITFNPELTLLEQNLIIICNTQITTIIFDNSSANLIDLKILVDKYNINFNKIHLFSFDKNYGLGKATNYIFDYALIKCFSYTFLFDQDTHIQQKYLNDSFNAITEIELINNYPAIMTPRSVNIANITKVSINTKSYKIFLMSNAIASCSLINMSIYKKIGGQLDELFIDEVDTEWFFRAKYFGYNIYSIFDNHVTHKIGDGILKFLNKNYNIHSPIRLFYRTRNIIYLFKFVHIPFHWKLKSFIKITFLTFLFIFKIKGTKFFYFKNYIKGLIFGFKSIFK